jgi:YggT family protein
MVNNMSGLYAVSYFLISQLFDLLLYILWIRIALRYFKYSPLHPVSQVIYKFTDPLVRPIDRLISSRKTRYKNFDWACLVVIIITEIINFVVLSFLIYGKLMPLFYLGLFVLSDFIMIPCNLLFYMILIRVIMSWVNPTWRHPVEEVIRTITNPLLKFGRYIIPDISGFDFSPYIIMIILKMIAVFMDATLPVRLWV